LGASLKSDPDRVISTILVLGEIGTMTDMSSIKDIIKTISSLFAHENDQIRQAAAICLGSISIGNTNFFLEKVFALITKSEANTKFMYMSTIKEIINIKPECLNNYLPHLLPLYLD
jgi:cullin-associated NEDD8-dissociated protein 1